MVNMNSPLNLDQFAPLFGAPKAQQYAYSADPDSVFVLLSWPTETIARALLGPITAAAQDGELHYFVCFVTDASGGQIAVKRFQKRWDNLNSIWPHLDSLLRCDPAMSLRPLNQRLMADQEIGRAHV